MVRHYLLPLNYAVNLDRDAEVHRRIALDRAWFASEYPLAGFEVS